jgi:hypothetical protein
MKKLINKNNVVVAVHAGEFHADDAACCALLQLAYGIESVTVRREFKIESTEGIDFVLDVGQIDEVSDNLVRLDHHPASGRQEDKGVLTTVHDGSGEDVPVPHCAFTKLAQLVLADESQEVQDELMQTVLVPLAMQDNGIEMSGFTPRVFPFGFVHAFNGAWDEDGSPAAQYDRFMQAVDVVRQVLDRIIVRTRSKFAASAIVNEAIANSKDGVVVMPRFAPWQDYVLAANNGQPTWKLVVFPSNRGGFMLQVVPKEAGSFASWVSIPESVKSCEGFVFTAHGAFAGFNTCEQALVAAKMILAEG